MEAEDITREDQSEQEGSSPAQSAHLEKKAPKRPSHPAKRKRRTQSSSSEEQEEQEEQDSDQDYAESEEDLTKESMKSKGAPSQSGQEDDKGSEEEDNNDEDGDDAASDGNDFCEVCKYGGTLLLCDFCDRAWHLGCLRPPLTDVRLPSFLQNVLK